MKTTISTIDQLAAVTKTITDALGDLAATVTTDSATARPTTGKVAALIEPPTLDWETWTSASITWTVDIIAGTAATQADSITLLLQAIDRLAQADVNLDTCVPITWTISGLGNLAAYQVRLNPLDNE